MKLEVRGASHARAIRFRLTGFPAGFKVDMAAVARLMGHRAPGKGELSSARRERDEIVWKQGIVNDVTTGEPIVGEIANEDARPEDYGEERTIPRPGHADFGQWIVMGRIPTGGGNNSGRMTVAYCAAGALCLQWLQWRGVHVLADIDSVGEAGACPSSIVSEIKAAKADGDSVGGIVRVLVIGVPPGIGGAMFDNLKSSIASAMLSIPGVRGVDFGLAFDYVNSRGSEFNDTFEMDDGWVAASSHMQGGLLGGRTYGGTIMFRLAVRPTPTIYKPQASVDLKTMKNAICKIGGRHDPCIIPRMLPIVEAMTALTIADRIMATYAAHPRICLTLSEPTIAKCQQQCQEQRYFVDMVELRADLLAASERERIGDICWPADTVNKWMIPIVLTYRRECDGGAFKGPERERIDFFRRKIPTRIARYVDFEADFHHPELERLAAKYNVKIIRSLHKFDGPVDDIPKVLRDLVGDRDEIAKLAFMPRRLSDVSRVFKQLEGRDDLPPHIVIAMGPLGLATRVLAGRLGSPWTYAGVLSDVGQLTPFELVRDYRLRTLAKHASLFGVTGWPLAKTRSPELHNAAFVAEDDDAVMIPFPSRTAKSALAFMKAMKMNGLAVTIPHKRGMLPLLDDVEHGAKRIGAVNTVVRRGNRLVGYNTDVEGFTKAIVDFAGDLNGAKVAILGDGGAARAVKAALRDLHARVRVFHRETPPKGFRLIVNATPVDPIPDYEFAGDELVYDLNYEPEVTSLMERAAKAGCKVSNGFSMLRAQAAAQQRLWRMA